MKKYCIAVLWSVYCIVFQATSVQAQQIVVGEPMPDFVLHNIQYYPKKQASLKDFRGKWLLLDLWSKACGACIMGFPNNNIIQKKFGDKLQVMLVGRQDREGITEPLYKGIREKENLILPCAFDSVFVKQYAEGLPNAILIDDKGIVRCWTYNIRADEVRLMMNGEKVNLVQAGDFKNGKKLIPYNPNKPFLTDNNGAKSDDFIFRSVLSKWDRNVHNSSIVYELDSMTAASGKLEILGAPVEQLYELAYWGVTGFNQNDPTRYGKLCNYLILQMKDTSLFEQTSARYNKNLYSYSLIIPKEKSTVSYMQYLMQEDLKKYFGYEVSLESRKCPYWKLVADAGAGEKLKTFKKAPAGRVFYKTGFVQNNLPFENVVGFLKDVMDLPVDDETGITGNVNIDMDCIPYYMEDLQKALKRNGLQLVLSEKEMNAVVIRDPKIN